ncbi:coiled-coil domain-containing protein 186 isoform X2 [Drosophila sechellia]|uniref:coiled-coil domain-containing protein 186 isoform X2 n=1 Tax=Drosophila sechellia TaxID=7238 RepID=UPI0013DE23E7|nr:coiled-coil domain-containing protein 186 isoform X2 [Drosophila sechellia]
MSSSVTPPSVRGNKAFWLRSGGKVEKPAPTKATWARTSPCGGVFSTPPVDNCDESPNISRLSRIPTRRGASPSSIHLRKTSLERLTSSPNMRPCISTYSLPNRRVEPEHNVVEPDRKTDIDEFNPPKRNVVPARTRVHTTPVEPNQIGKKTEKGSHLRVLELNRMRVFETQKKKLENLQSEFMHKIRSMGSDLRNQGVFKFVGMTVNDECKLVVHQDDLLRLPKIIPSESINDLKTRCRAIVEQGVMLVYDHIPRIQRAQNDLEASEKREETQSKLSKLVEEKMTLLVEEIEQLCGAGSKHESPNKSLYREIGELRSQKQAMEVRYFDAQKEHTEQINQLRADLDAKLKQELASRDQIIVELRKSLRRSEDMLNDQSIRLAENNSKLLTEDSTIEVLRSEVARLMAVKAQMVQRLESADMGLERARNSVDKNLKQIDYLEGELKEARELIVHLQKRPDAMDAGVKEKDLIIADLKLQLQGLEQHKKVMNKQVENTIKQHADLEELGNHYKEALQQISDLKETLNVTNAKLDMQSKLEVQLRKEVSKMREQSVIDQKLLRARSELIATLQKNGQDSSTKLDQMYYQVNNQLMSKEEEFQNLYGTLTHKQIEVRRQEHIIKLLKEQNSRVSLLRANQDERNATMEEEIINLKNTIRDYAKLIVCNIGQNFFEVVPAGEAIRSCGHRQRVDSSFKFLQEPNLQDANLQDANLQDAKQQEPNLQDAKQQEPNLQDTNLQDANMQDANLQDANLQDGNLQDANLQDANLQDASLQEPTLQDANMPQPRIFEPLQHQLFYHIEPSPVGQLNSLRHLLHSRYQLQHPNTRPTDPARPQNVANSLPPKPPLRLRKSQR